MVEDESMASLRARLQSRSGRVLEEAISAAVIMGTEGERCLVDALDDAPIDTRVIMTSALADCTGDAGVPALRRLLRQTGPGSALVHQAAIHALSARCGADSTPEMMEALASRSGDVRFAAVVALAETGDQRACDAVYEWLSSRLARSTRRGSLPCEVGVAVTYLLRHASSDPTLAQRTKELLQRRWHHLDIDEREWLRAYWQEAQPGVNPRVDGDGYDVAAMARWLEAPEPR